MTPSPPRPTALPVNESGIPEGLRALPRWFTWSYALRDGDWTKPPTCAATGEAGKSTDPATYAGFDHALSAYQAKQYDGIGFALTAVDRDTGELIGEEVPFAAVDLDHCRDPATGVIAGWAWKIIGALSSYTEISPSATGIRIIVLAPGRRGGRRKGKIEIYSTSRYVTITGCAVPGTPAAIALRTAELDALVSELFPLPPSALGATPARRQASGGPRGGQRAAGRGEASSAEGFALTDDEDLLRVARAAKNGGKFVSLYDHGDIGAYEGDDSAADAGLVNLLAFWTGPDPGRIDQLFRRSALCRPKWQDRADYRERTIAFALSGKTDFYSPPLRVVTGGRNGSEGVRGVARGSNGAAESDGGQQGAEAEVEPIAPLTLAQVRATFAEWLELEDDGHLVVALGAVAANYLSGDAVWLMLVGASGAGKTEVLNSLSGLPKIHHASSITEAALLSGTSKKDRDRSASGGLLRTIGEFGILCLRDFTSILSMHHDARTRLLAALREIYDGAWSRDVGVDGHRKLTWEGKLGLVAGVTPTIDGHFAVNASCGERFVYYRLPRPDDRKQATRALSLFGQEGKMRRSLAAAVTALFAGITFPAPPSGSEAESKPVAQPAIAEGEHKVLLDLACLAVRCRSAVERDGKTREIELIIDAEAPARLVKVLARLFVGMTVIGVDRAEALSLVAKVAVDSMPALRWKALVATAAATGKIDTTKVAIAVKHPTNTTRRALEDLTAHGVTIRYEAGKGKADLWEVSGWAKGLLGDLSAYLTRKIVVDSAEERESLLRSPDTTLDDLSGKVPPAGDSDGRRSSCWGCGSEVDQASDDLCARCGWIQCSSCGACQKGGCSGDGTLRLGLEEPLPPRGAPAAPRGLEAS